MESVERRRQIWLLSALLFLTFALMIFFKYNSPEMTSIIKRGQNNLLAFYANSLKPIFESEKISQKDVFNFAVSGSLPLDTTKHKVLKVETPDKGQAVFSIANVKPKPIETDYYSKFISENKLSSKQIAGLDSILDNYKSHLSNSVLYGKNNSYAINKSLKEVLTSLRLDLQKFDFNKGSNIIDSQFSVKLDSVRNLLRTEILAKKNKYMMVTPDTLVDLIAEVRNEFDDALKYEKLKNNVASFKLAPFAKGKGLPESKVIFDSSAIKISIADSIDFSIEAFANAASINIADSNNFISFMFNADTAGGKFGLSIAGKDEDSSFALKMNFDPEKLTEFIGASISAFSKLSDTDDEEIGQKFDSLMKEYTFFNLDSAKSKEEIIKIKNKIKKLRKKHADK